MTDNPNRNRFQAAYEGKPPWDLGRPQRPFIEVADQITGSVLDAGCGTGDNALFFAQRGQPVVGIDVPLVDAKRKAGELGVDAEFLQMDALKLTSLDRQFDSVIDCGLFHVLSDADRSTPDALLRGWPRPGRSPESLGATNHPAPEQTGGKYQSGTNRSRRAWK